MKENKPEKPKFQPKLIKNIPLNTVNNRIIRNKLISKKNFNSLSSNNEIFLKSSKNFLKNKPSQEQKYVTGSSQTKPKPIHLIEFFTPKEIVEKFSKYLNTFEQEEIFLFQEIYYCGKFLKNKQQMIKIESNSNLGSSLVRNNTSTNEDDKNINLKSEFLLF